MAAGDTKLVYGTEAALTITLASLATSSTLTVGRESTAIVNTSNLFIDCLLAGKITTGTSPTTGMLIHVYAYGQVEDTPTYPGGVTGSDAALTPATPLTSYLRLAASIATDATSDKTYWFGPLSVAALFGGILPPRWGVWVTHSTVVVLNATAGNHAIWYQPVYYNVAAA